MGVAGSTLQMQFVSIARFDLAPAAPCSDSLAYVESQEQPYTPQLAEQTGLARESLATIAAACSEIVQRAGPRNSALRWGSVAFLLAGLVFTIIAISGGTTSNVALRSAFGPVLLICLLGSLAARVRHRNQFALGMARALPELAQYLQTANSRLLVPMGLALVAGERQIFGGREAVHTLELRFLQQQMLFAQHGLAVQGANPLYGQGVPFAMQGAPFAMQGAHVPYAPYAAAQPPVGYAQPVPYARPAGVVVAPPGAGVNSPATQWTEKGPPPPPAIL
jgi:hypothetical protein